MACTEELMIKKNIDIDLTNFDPLGGFEWVRRSLPVQTIARGQGSTATKVIRILHCAHLESGCISDVEEWRKQTKHFLSDQGTEMGMVKAPVGPWVEVESMLERVKAGTLQLNSEEVQRLTFLPKALQQSGVLHIFWNAVQEA